MRSIKKRLTVKNDGFAKTSKSADCRMNNVVNRYLKKMSMKGWIPLYVSAGNAFFVYESYIRMVSPSAEEIEQYEKNAVSEGFIKENGAWKIS